MSCVTLGWFVLRGFCGVELRDRGAEDGEALEGTDGSGWIGIN